jgi:hypothetical protein
MKTLDSELKEIQAEVEEKKRELRSLEKGEFLISAASLLRGGFGACADVDVRSEQHGVHAKDEGSPSRDREDQVRGQLRHDRARFVGTGPPRTERLVEPS